MYISSKWDHSNIKIHGSEEGFSIFNVNEILMGDIPCYIS